MPDIPKVPGVPPLASYAIDGIVLATADALILFNAGTSLFFSQWGIYLNGVPIITPAGISSAISSVLSEVSTVASIIGLPNIVPTIASTIEFDYSADSPISNYPQEQGAFQSYNKVQLPAEIGLTLACGGSPTQRQAFLNILESLRTSVVVVDIVTPEQVYQSYNLYHYDLRRTAENGVTLIQANAKFQLVPMTAQATPGANSSTTQAISNPQQPSAASPQALGNVQPVSAFGATLGNPSFNSASVF